MQFIADFYCHEAKLVIEVDGDIHEEIKIAETDEGRTFELERYGIRILRFTNEEVFFEMPKVLERIKNTLAQK